MLKLLFTLTCMRQLPYNGAVRCPECAYPSSFPLPVQNLMTQSSELSQSYTLALLTRLDILIRREVLNLRLHQTQPGDDEFRGLYISNEEVDELLSESLLAAGLVSSARITPDVLASLDNALLASQARIEAVEKSAEGCGQALRLNELCRKFGLSALEREVLVICLAAEVNLKYERLYAYLHDDVTKKRPTVDLVLRLLCSKVEERVGARRSFEADAPIIRWELITLHDDPNARRPVLLARCNSPRNCSRSAWVSVFHLRTRRPSGAMKYVSGTPRIPY